MQKTKSKAKIKFQKNRKLITIVPIAVILLIAGVGVYKHFFSSPTFASPNGELCIPTAGGYCMKLYNNINTTGTPIVMAAPCNGTCAAYVVDAIPLGTYYDAFYPEYELEYQYHSGHCIGSNDAASGLILRNCYGANGTVWARDGNYWINRYASNHFDCGGSYLCYATGQQTINKQMWTSRLGAAGWHAFVFKAP